MGAAAVMIASGVSGAALPAQAAPSTPTSIAIPVGGEPLGVAVDPGTHSVFVTNEDDNTVSVIDETSNTVTHTISVGQRPYGVAVDPGTHTVYVTNGNSGTVSVIDEASNTVTHTMAWARPMRAQ